METKSADSTAPNANGPTPNQRTYNNSAYTLVKWMLTILCILVVGMGVLSALYSSNDKIIDLVKWALTTLLGAFGAWIGAGAAYFFGKENLIESSASTEAAMKIQLGALQGVAKPERIRELALTAMNKEFMFNSSNTRKEVTDKLRKPQFSGYWWVPVFDQGGNGTLEDVIHARVFWDTTFEDNATISAIRKKIDDENANADLRQLHGAPFFVRVVLDDKVADVAKEMDKPGATVAVGIVVDEKGKPTYCFSKGYLLNAQK